MQRSSSSSWLGGMLSKVSQARSTLIEIAWEFVCRKRSLMNAVFGGRWVVSGQLITHYDQELCHSNEVIAMGGHVTGLERLTEQLAALQLRLITWARKCYSGFVTGMTGRVKIRNTTLLCLFGFLMLPGASTWQTAIICGCFWRWTWLFLEINVDFPRENSGIVGPY